MKHRFTTLSSALTLFVLFITTNAFAAEQHNVTITGYAPTKYSVTDDDVIARQLANVEREITSTLSRNKGNVILTIDVYGNADETGSARDNQDYGTKRAVEVQNAIASEFQNFPGVTVHVYEHTNGTKSNKRSTDVIWTITPIAAPAPSQESRTQEIKVISLVALLVIIILALPTIRGSRKGQRAITPKPTAGFVEIEFEWNGKRCSTVAERMADGLLHTKISLPTKENAFVIRRDSKDVQASLRGLAKKPSYQPTMQRLIAEKIVRIKEAA